MKNTVFVIALLSLIMLFNQNIYASDVEYWNVDAEAQISGLSKLEPTTCAGARGLFNQAFSKYVDFTKFNYIGTANEYYSSTFFYFPKGTVSVLDSQNDDNYIYLRTYKLVDNVLVELEYQWLSCHYNGNNSNPYVRIFEPRSNYYPVIYTECGVSNLKLEQVCSQPIASNEEMALLYLQTGDYSYLDNAEEIAKDNIEVPAPKNLSMYKASDEKLYYLYYENETYEGSYEIKTFVNYDMQYQDSSGIQQKIIEPYTECYDYFTRNQISVDYTELEQYDSFNCEFAFYNGINIGTSDEPIWIYSNKVVINRPMWHYNSYFIDKYDGDSCVNTLEYVLNDYKEKNETFTGSYRKEYEGSISSPGNSSYSFFDNLFNGFGLVGDNGALQMIGDSIDVIPNDIITMIEVFVGLACIIGLFKMAFGG